jgi:hypothetical protein
MRRRREGEGDEVRGLEGGAEEDEDDLVPVLAPVRALRFPAAEAGDGGEGAKYESRVPAAFVYDFVPVPEEGDGEGGGEATHTQG